MLAGAMLMASSSAIRGDTITYTDSLVNALTDINATLPVSQFDPSLGNLTSAAVSLTGSTISTWSVTNTTPNSIATVGLRISDQNVTMDITGPVGLDAHGYQDFEQSRSQAYSVSPLGAGDTYTFLPATISYSVSDSGTFTSPSDLANFIGVGVVNYSAVTVSSSTSSTNAPSWADMSYASAYVSVTYTYTPVPEPASVVLLGLGAAGLWWAARRRRKN